MKKYAIKNDYIAEGRTVAILNYDETNAQFTIDIPAGVSEKDMPFVMAASLKRGIRHIGPELSMKWVQGRIVPSGRQNIGQILRANGMKNYDEHALLIKNQGRSCQDEYYIEEI